ncbi:hypothetical protein D5E70_15430 [Vibrio parahaemolyticus]|nr:hypothetical protein D5E70_15430 [Vibrio parahaemolyticus]
MAVPHAIESDGITIRSDIGTISDTRIRNQSISTLPSNSQVARQPDSVVLPDHKAIEEKNKKPINQYANDHTDQSKSPSTWVSEVLTQLREAIKSLAGCINRREAEARELGNIYQATQLNCDRLDRMLKERGVTRSTLEPLHRFKRGGNQVTISALQPRSD